MNHKTLILAAAMGPLAAIGLAREAPRPMSSAELALQDPIIPPRQPRGRRRSWISGKTIITHAKPRHGRTPADIERIEAAIAKRKRKALPL